VKYLIDTNIFSFAMRKHLGLDKKLEKMRKKDLATSVVVMAEGLTGAEKIGSVALRELWQSFAQTWVVLDFDLACAKQYSRIRAELESRGCMIGIHDAQIAATALVHKLVLVTDNTDEFGRVPGLIVENWALKSA